MVLIFCLTTSGVVAYVCKMIYLLLVLWIALYDIKHNIQQPKLSIIVVMWQLKLLQENIVHLEKSIKKIANPDQL